MNRRDLLTTAGLMAGVAMALAACQTGPNGQLTLPSLPVTLPPNVSQLIDDANSIVSKISSIVPAGNPQAVALFSNMKTAAGQIARSTVVQDAQAALSVFNQAWTALRPVLSTQAGSNSTVSTVLTAVETVLPVMLKVAGLVAMFARQQPTGMTVAQARAVLHS